MSKRNTEHSKLREKLSNAPELNMRAVVEYDASHNKSVHDLNNVSVIRLCLTSKSMEIKEIFGMPIKVPNVVIFDYIMN